MDSHPITVEKLRSLLAEAFCPLPNVMRNLEEYRRLDHHDLAAMTDRELWRETKRTELRLAIEEPSNEWVGKRLLAIEEERRRKRS